MAAWGSRWGLARWSSSWDPSTPLFVSVLGPAGTEVTERVSFGTVGWNLPWVYNRAFVRFVAHDHETRYARRGALWRSEEDENPVLRFPLDADERPIFPGFEFEFEPGGLMFNASTGMVVAQTNASHVHYARTLYQLLPPNPLRDADHMTRLLRAMSRELARVDYRARQVLRESVASTATVLLPAYESLLGLPTCLHPQGGTLEERRTSVVGAKAENRTALVEHIEALVVAAGFTLTNPVVRSLADPFTCESSCEDAVQSTTDAYTIQITTDEDVPEDHNVRCQVASITANHAHVVWVTAE